MQRRRFLAGAGTTLLAGPALADALPIPPTGAIGFKVLRNGSPIGEHHLTFTQTGDDLAVNIAVALDVYIAGIRFFHYTLAATERWSAGVFQSLESKIDNNGTALEVQAHKTAAGYDVLGINHTHPEKSYPEYTTPPNTMPLTYWNKAMLNGTILNIQTAHSYPAIVTSPGWNKLPTASGGAIIAQRFDVTGKLHLSVWYDQSSQWAGLQFNINGTESYEKIT
jgi:hypothetical protein